MLYITNLNNIFVTKNLKRLICYLKNLKERYITNIKLEGPKDAFWLRFYIETNLCLEKILIFINSLRVITLLYMGCDFSQ
jgi:hypothetical protein